jgi:glycerol uptake facilitator-like aquaporin
MTEQTLLITILIGAFIMMIGILFFKEPDNRYQNTLTENMAWAIGFALLISIQMTLIAAMG